MSLRTCAACLLFTAFPMVGLAALGLSLPRAVPSQPILVVGVPGLSNVEAMVSRAGGYPIGPTRPPLGLLVHSQDPDFLSDLRAQWPYLLLNADKLSNFMCGRNA